MTTLYPGARVKTTHPTSRRQGVGIVLRPGETIGAWVVDFPSDRIALAWLEERLAVVR